MPPRRLRLPGALALALAGVSCADVGDALPIDGPSAAVSQPIDGGYLDTVDTNVVGVVSLANGSIAACSGSLIAPNVVLTAQHCVAPISTGQVVNCATSTFGNAYKANAFFVTTKVTFSQDPADYHAVKSLYLPAKNPLACGNDLAILVLTKPIEASEAVPLVPRVDVPMAAKEAYHAVGYGQRGEGKPSGTRQRRDGLESRCVGAACGNTQVADAEWLGDTGICQGDSGGPAIDAQGRVVGVVSRGGPNCSMPIYGGVEPWADWIRGVAIEATADAGIEPPDWTTGYPTDPIYHFEIGGACSTINDCESNACFDGYCTRSCSAEAYCPVGFECGANGFCQKPMTPMDDTTTTTVTEASCSLTGERRATNPLVWMGLVSVALAWSLRTRRRL